MPLPSSSLNNRWIDALQAGDVTLVRQMLDMGAHPFDVLERVGEPQRFESPNAPGDTIAYPVQRASLWQWAINAPTTDALEAMVPTINRDLRRAGPNGKRWVLDAWRAHRWGFAQLFASASPNPDRLHWLIDQTETWLTGAPGRWDAEQSAPWASPTDAWTKVVGYAEHHHHPMQRFQREAVLMAMVEAGNAAAWAVPVVHRLWGAEALGDWIDAGENRAQHPLNLAMGESAFELAAALVRTGAFERHLVYTLAQASRLLFAPIAPRTEPEDDHDRGLPRLLMALFDQNAPLTGYAPGIAWVPWLAGDGERLEVEPWPQVRIDPGRNRPSQDPRFKTRTPVKEVLHRWFVQQAKWRANTEENGPRVRIAGIANEDYEPVRQRWEAMNLRALMNAPDLPVPATPVRHRL